MQSNVSKWAHKKQIINLTENGITPDYGSHNRLKLLASKIILIEIPFLSNSHLMRLYCNNRNSIITAVLTNEYRK